jgi:hypothetical protein
MWASWDGDLRGWTRVDVVPLYGMQEVWGSSPLTTWCAIAGCLA